ncbi:tripartite tricarboxylate transporter permease [Streptomyces sp. DSM 42041]|uniref:Tripartite tricarboxylate transporter permease n=1 Tax=Streptomyces hazeniae TaxID=3075538 RepID=A0ABU2NN35_9ACTN|nr:tripartite tricarboxylate transporter permease [Streptomyces sp. DSM 42041]MDT0378175.1 tripartite tricarboxylate transporter permease [Streptomyces sp. DSM 42041]
MLDAAFSALGALLDPATLVFLLAGVLAGLVVGIVPGLGGTGAVAILLPFIFVVEPHQALALITGAVAVVHTSDTISTVLIGIPGSASATVLMLDGHAMARQGQAARALSIAFLASMAGGLLGAVGLTLSIPLARPLVLNFGSPELFMLTVLGISLAALLSRGNMLKGLVAGVFGLLLGQVGAAPSAADYRFTFGSLFLNEGLDLVAVALAIFGIAEVVSQIARRTSVAAGSGIGSGWGAGVRDVLRHWTHVLRGALIGIWAGVLPGVGATAGTWMAYGQARATERRKGKGKGKFGKGDPRGIIAPESANNSVEAGDLIPTLLFGIPGGAPAALLLGALLVFGVEPGPRMITNHLDVIYTIVWSFALASVAGAALCFLLSKPLAKLSFVRFPVLAAGLVVILFTAGYQESQQVAVLQVMLLLGAVGWLMKVTGFPRAPFLIGFVLSVPLERYYYLTANLYSFSEWALRPGVLVMAAILVAPLGFALVRRLRARGTPAAPATVTAGATADTTDATASADTAATTDTAATADTAADTADEEADGPAAPRRWTVGVAAGFLALFLCALFAAQGYSEKARLVPTLVCALGVLLTVTLLAVQAYDRRRASGKPADTGSWRQELRWVGQAFGWLIAFLVLVYVLGVALAALVFVPVFLWRVAQLRARGIVLYTVGVLAALLLLQHFADISLPVGYLTPPLLMA